MTDGWNLKDMDDDELDDSDLDPIEAAALRAADAELDLEPGEDVDEFAGAYVSPDTDDADQSAATTTPAEPAEVVGFFDAGADLYALDDLAVEGRTVVLERLGPAHFRSKGFSFMGFLQTVYDHVATEVARPTPSAPAAPWIPPPAPEPEPTPEVAEPAVAEIAPVDVAEAPIDSTEILVASEETAVESTSAESSAETLTPELPDTEPTESAESNETPPENTPDSKPDAPLA